MSLATLATTIAKTTAAPPKKAQQAASAVLKTIALDLKKSGKFTLPGFGTFTVRQMKARKARNPGTGEIVKVKASKSVSFKPSPALRKMI